MAWPDACCSLPLRSRGVVGATCDHPRHVHTVTAVPACDPTPCHAHLSTHRHADTALDRSIVAPRPALAYTQHSHPPTTTTTSRTPHHLSGGLEGSLPQEVCRVHNIGLGRGDVTDIVQSRSRRERWMDGSVHGVASTLWGLEGGNLQYSGIHEGGPISPDVLTLSLSSRSELQG